MTLHVKFEDEQKIREIFAKHPNKYQHLSDVVHAAIELLYNSLEEEL